MNAMGQRAADIIHLLSPFNRGSGSESVFRELKSVHSFRKTQLETPRLNHMKPAQILTVLGALTALCFSAIAPGIQDP
jgi:hypothetical protein